MSHLWSTESLTIWLVLVPLQPPPAVSAGYPVRRDCSKNAIALMQRKVTLKYWIKLAFSYHYFLYVGFFSFKGFFSLWVFPYNYFTKLDTAFRDQRRSLNCIFGKFWYELRRFLFRLTAQSGERKWLITLWLTKPQHGSTECPFNTLSSLIILNISQCSWPINSAFP